MDTIYIECNGEKIPYTLFGMSKNSSSDRCNKDNFCTKECKMYEIYENGVYKIYRRGSLPPSIPVSLFKSKRSRSTRRSKNKSKRRSLRRSTRRSRNKSKRRSDRRSKSRK